MKNKFIFKIILRKLSFLAVFALLHSSLSAETGVTLNLKDADIRSLIETVAEATARNFVVDPRVKAKVTVVSARPMSREEVYQVFLSVLQVHGYAAVQVGEIIKILPDVNAKQGPVTTAGGQSQGTGDELVTRVVQIKHVPAAQMVPILRPLVPQQGHLAAYPNSNVLVVSDRAANIQRLISIIGRIDRPDSQEIEVVPLEHASATEVVRIINSLNQQAGQAGQVPGQTTLAADERTNSILLSGDSSARVRVRGLIAHLDTPLDAGESGNTQVVFLKHATATEIAPILLGVSQFDAQNAPAQGGANAAAAPVGSQQEVDIQADESTNSLIITASPSKFEELRSIIKQLDIRRAQVIVDAIIADVDVALAKELGVQFASIPSPDSSGSRPAVGNISNNTPITGGSIAGLLGDNPIGAITNGFFAAALDISGSTQFAAILNAIETDTASNILSTPTLVTLDNEEAEIVVADNVPFITGNFTNTGAGSGDTVNPFQTIEREDVGITLRITPQINEGDSIRLDVETESSSIAPAVTGASDIITNRNSIRTSVIVKDQQTLVLGGLIEDQFSDSVQKIPLLGDIPLLGHLFRSTATTKSKENLMVFIHPVIIRDQATTDLVTNAKYNFLQARQIEANIDDRGLIRKGTQLLPDLDDMVMQIPNSSSTNSPTSVDQLLEQAPSVDSQRVDQIELKDIQLENESIAVPAESDVIILE